MSLPNATGFSISDLKTGQVVYVADEKKTVAAINGFSGICTDGTLLNCNTAASIEPTEEFVPEVILEESTIALLTQHSLLEEVQAAVDEYNNKED